MLLATGSALVAGGAAETDMQTKQVRVLRAFYFNGEPTKVGAIASLPKVFADEMIAAKKAEAVEALAPKPPAPSKSVAGDNAKKGDKDA